MIRPETYTRHRETADRLIARYGGGAVLVQKGELTGPSYDPVQGPDVETPVRYIETGYQVGLHDGTLIQTGDVLGVMAVPISVTPLPVDKLRIDGLDHSLFDVRPIQPSPDAPVVQFSFQARR
tara:strand:- start:6816 stop:7184 length:369 start_codon:yes stop_codon:yes gene_type:complete